MKSIKLRILHKVINPYPTWDVTGMNLIYLYAKLMLENLLFFFSRTPNDGYLFIFRTFTWRP